VKRLSLFISLISFSVFAQEPTYVFEDTINDKNLVKFSSYNTYSSNRFNNEFMDKFLFGGTIDQELKDLNANRLGRMNTFGGEFEQRVDSYSPSINLFKKEHLGLKLSFSDNHYISSNVPTGLFNLAMYGNAGFQGDSLDLTFAHAQYQHYQKFSVGFFDERNLSSIQLSYVAGSKAAEFGLSSSHFYTSPDADSVSLNLSGSGVMTDRFSPYWAFQGGGFAIDIDYNFIFEGRGKNRPIINFNYWVKDKLYFGAGTFDLLGLVSKKIGFGRGFNFAMYYKL
jgi:hypothetical protein